MKSRAPVYSVEIAEDSGFATVHANADGIDGRVSPVSTFAITEGEITFMYPRLTMRPT